MTPIKSDCCPELQDCRDEKTKCTTDLAAASKKLEDKEKELKKAKEDLDDANKKVEQSKKDLDACKNPPGSGTPPNQKPLNPATCGEHKSVSPRVPLIRHFQGNHAMCKNACLAEPKCKAYNVIHWTGSQKSGGCWLYAKPAEELTTVINKIFRLYNRDC